MPGRWHAAIVVGGALVGAGASPAPARAAPVRVRWGNVATPTSGPAQVIGRHAAACLSGGRLLPVDGPGYQAVDLSRRRTFGHPALISFIADLGRAADARQLGTVLVGDLAQPRGGPMSSGHVSHQGGLDVDIWYRLDVAPRPVAEREGLSQPSVVDARSGRPDTRRWTARHAELVRIAATDPRVSRVFVGAAIKRDLCERSAAGDRGWLRVVRTWPGHDDHLHVRLRCPADSPACLDQPPLPLGDGCSPAELAAAIARERVAPPRPPPSHDLPAACEGVLAAKDAGDAVSQPDGDHSLASSFDDRRAE